VWCSVPFVSLIADGKVVLRIFIWTSQIFGGSSLMYNSACR